MICLKGDQVRTKAGEIGEVVEIWGVARTWYKLRTADGKIVYAMTEHIESILKRHSNKRGRAAK